MDTITDQNTLEQRIKPLHDEKFITVDTEFIREKTYYPQLCLIQIAGDNDAFAIDPLAANIDLAPLYELFDDENVIKVFHACGQDIEIILHEHHKIPTPLFDTQVAAQVLGYGEAVSYGKLVEKICGEEIDKSSCRTDWAKRPLSKKQIDYAISDVTHLRKIYVSLIESLKEMERLAWAEEEMEKFLSVEAYIVDPEEAWKVMKLKTGKPQFLGIAKELARWRELRAQEIDKPRRWVLKDDALLEIASLAPKDAKDLENLRFFSIRNKQIAEEIIDAVERGGEVVPPVLEKKKPLPKGSAPLIELLKVMLKMRSEEHKIAPSILARSDDLKELAMSDTPDIPAMHGWRFDIFGKYAMALKHGKLALAIEDNNIIMLGRVEKEGSDVSELHDVESG